MVTRFRYYLSCLEDRKMFIVTACQLLSHYALIMDYSLILLLFMWNLVLAAMKVLKEIFWNVSIKCYRFHLGQVCMVGTNTESHSLIQEYKRSKSAKKKPTSTSLWWAKYNRLNVWLMEEFSLKWVIKFSLK